MEARMLEMRESGCKLKEIAAECGCSISHVHQCLKRAKGRMMVYQADYGCLKSVLDARPQAVVDHILDSLSSMEMRDRLKREYHSLSVRLAQVGELYKVARMLCKQP